MGGDISVRGLATWEMFYSHLKPGRVKYSRSIVSYLDILGFRELVETKTPGSISRILRILAESVKPEPIFKSEKVRFTRFSDTVIRSMPETTHYPRNFIFELRSILHAQIALIPEGIPIRGAVTIGDIVQSWGVVYGPAVVRAYELEGRKGAPPRIIIDEETWTTLQPAIDEEDLDRELRDLIKIEESTIYLDYLRACEFELNVPEQEYPIFLSLHRDFIRNALTRYAFKPQIRAKYEWLREYHERTLRERFGPDIPQHLRV